MRLIVTALAMSGIAATAVHAADIPPPAPRMPVHEIVAHNWSGFYMGLNAGFGWGRTTGAGIPSTIGGQIDTSGGLVGAQLGFNYQVHNFVWGLEADWAWANIDGSGTGGAPPVTIDSRINHLGTLRGRLGFAFDRTLLYGTGGLAWAGHRLSVTGLGSETRTHAGWTLGAGIEHAFTPNWSAKIEYLYVDLNKKDYFTAACVAACDTGARANIIRAGLNYKFNW